MKRTLNTYDTKVTYKHTSHKKSILECIKITNIKPQMFEFTYDVFYNEFRAYISMLPYLQTATQVAIDIYDMSLISNL